MHRFRIRLILALIFSVTVVSVATTYFDVLAHRHVLRRELERRTQWMGISLLPDVEGGLRKGDTAALGRLLQSLRGGTGALDLAVYDLEGHLLASAGDANILGSSSPGVHQNSLGSSVLGSFSASPVARAIQKRIEVSEFGATGSRDWLEVAFPLYVDNQLSGSMALVVDAGTIRSEANAVWRRSFLLIAICVVLIVAITAGMVSWFLMRPMGRIAERLRHLRTGQGKTLEPEGADLGFFSPIAREVESMARSLKAARAAASAEAQLRASGENWWTAERLTQHLRSLTGARRIFVVSNREPYIHQRDGYGIDCVVPPSGLVTALEPVLRACDGVWVAHGSGDADTNMVDAFDRLRVPPDDPKYTLRRVWLTRDEEARYYDGFANEGLWPLCHIAHTRPIFRAADWECYQSINERFARALISEMKDSPEPIVFVQDYHFALLPRIIKQLRPDARVAIFWHIPWPNPEAFGICPWQNEILDGLLGADLIGFHIPLHCHNFLSTVDLALETRTSHEHMTTRRRGHITTVRPYPISVAIESALHPRSESPCPAAREAEHAAERQALLQPFGVRADYLAVGVDRLDYTKGIVERLTAFEQLLEDEPWYCDRLTFVEIAAPSRTRIPAYADLRVRVEEAVERINARYHTAHWKPVILIERQCSHEEVHRWYTAADLCLVTSLHDGMNLVAKEFVVARNDEDGVLVLSRFAGAAQELLDALIVNPYDSGAVAAAIDRGLQMSPAERRERMRHMRRHVLEHNVYRWASTILSDLRELRIESEENPLSARSEENPLSARAASSAALPELVHKKSA